MNHQHSMQFGELYIDLFAGGGGSSTGMKLATGREPDIAINHDGPALAAHCANHPDTAHYKEDVFARCPTLVCGDRPVGLLWLSPTCTHFSKAKGAKLLDKKIRALSWVAVRWAKKVKPRIICLENVEEYISHGPLDLSGKPIPEKVGTLFRHFVRGLKKYGYNVEWRILHAHHYGAPTSRKRLFLVARCDGEPIVWPTQTHGPGLIPYRTAAECIDWSIPCPSIFTRKKPLVDATCRRIAKGIQKFIVEVDEPFIAPVNSERYFRAPTMVQTGYGERKGQSPRALDLHKPLGTVVAGEAKHALVTAFISKFYTGVTGHGLERPLGTVTTVDHHSIVAANLSLIGNCSDNVHSGSMMDESVRTTETENRFAVSAFMLKYYGTNYGQATTEPLHTITTKDRFALVVVSGEKYVITDIGMRMLQPRELFTAQGFAEDYVIDPIYNGKPLNKATQIRLCGNSVSPPCAAALLMSNQVGNPSERAA